MREVAKKVIFLMAVPLRDGWGGGCKLLAIKKKKNCGFPNIHRMYYRAYSQMKYKNDHGIKTLFST